MFVIFNFQSEDECQMEKKNLPVFLEKPHLDTTVFSFHLLLKFLYFSLILKGIELTSRFYLDFRKENFKKY